MAAKLDHAVINVHYAMDEARSLFQSLGFQLTERGFHSLGSINHLMMFGNDYLELIGLPIATKGLPPGRPEVMSAPVGINGLVFKTDDADATFAHLQARGMAGDPPKSFSRPVVLPDRTLDAHFRTVTAHAGIVGGGRVYFCDHKTPELVWRDGWQDHANGARSISEFVVVSETRADQAARLATLVSSSVEGTDDRLTVPIDGAKLTVLSPAAYGARYGPLASPLADRRSLFGALVLTVDEMAPVLACAHQAGVSVLQKSDSLVVRIPAFDCVLEFTAGD